MVPHGDKDMKKFSVVASALVLGLSFASYGTEIEGGIAAPLGLKWGESKESIIKNYNATPADKNDTRIKLYSLANPPIKVPGFDEIYGVVDDKYGLVKVVMIESIHKDAYGSQGIEEYKKYSAILTKKYGKPSDKFEYTGKELYKESDEFYQCLNYQGCGAYFSFYKTPGKAVIGLELKGKRRGEGYLSINYESSLFDKVIQERDGDSNDKAEQGL